MTNDDSTTQFGADGLHDDSDWSVDEPTNVSPIENLPNGTEVGRYRIQRHIGSGGFGAVYQAWDPRLHRDVALKLSRPERFEGQDAWTDFLEEGRAVANLSHECLIPVFDVERLEDGTAFVVMEFVEGVTLREHVRNQFLTTIQKLAIVRNIARGLRYAHTHSVVHRDLKPANIIVDEKGDVRIADFGLAIRVNAPLSRTGRKVAGTYTYMAPEQIRGENHRLDGRTDIWALGVIIFWLFTNQKPFDGETPEDVAHEICNRELAPIRQINSGLPREVDRICRNCLQKRMAARYQTAADLIEDIDLLMGDLVQEKSQDRASDLDLEIGEADSVADPSSQTSATSNTKPKALSTKVVAKGLHAFGRTDSDFFLKLLPGPRDRNGLPESLRFWIEFFSETDFKLPIGLIYGPSGCGKTSFVRAGLIPNLPQNVTYIYCQADSDSLCEDIARRIHAKFPQAGRGELAEQLREIRVGRYLPPERRLVIVVDQFEQWIYEQDAGWNDPLVLAMRQVDGSRIQVLFLVRDDFWIPVQQFFEHLELRIQDGRNSQALPTFDLRHAKKVLTLFGQSHERLPEPDDELEKFHGPFLDEAIELLQDRNRVICGHVALFAEIMKHRNWDLAELNESGGWRGLAVDYLEERFGVETAHPSLRRSLAGIRELLSELLPPVGRKIKTASMTATDLRRRCGSFKHQDHFREIATQLETEYRLLTRAEDDGLDEDSVVPKYQLSHDLLIDPIRFWLNREKRQTWQGRAELKLKEYAEFSGQEASAAYLPSLFEYLSIRLGVQRTRIEDRERRVLAQAEKRMVFRGGLGLLLGILLAVAFGYLWNQSNRQIALNRQLAQFLDVESAATEEQLDFFERYKGTLAEELKKFDPATTRGKLRKAMLAVRFNDQNAPQFEEELRSYLAFLPDTDPAEFNFAAEIVGEYVDEKTYRSTFRDVFMMTDRSPQARARLAIFNANVSKFTSVAENFASMTKTLAEGAVPNEAGMKLQTWLPDPSNRNWLLFEFKNRFRGDARQLLDVLDEWPNEKVKSGFLMMLADTLAIDELPDKYTVSQNEVAQVLEEYYERSDSALIHSAATYGLRKLGRFDYAATQRSDSKDWFVNPQGVTMLRIPEKPGPAGIPSIWMSDTEISWKLFGEFLEETDRTSLLENLKTKDNWPATGLGPRVIQAFLEWLNQKNQGLLSEPNGGSLLYRLPTIDELTWASSGGATTPTFVGRFDVALAIMPRFVRCHTDGPSTKQTPAATGVHFPNLFGIFDSLGNAEEFCLDKIGGEITMTHGGSYVDSRESISNSGVERGDASSRFFGFRIVLAKESAK